MPQTNLKPIPSLLETAISHGLKPEEYQKVISILGREPNLVELGIFSVMWSEHCSYKSTRIHLKKLPTTAPWVICGPGENAGVIDIGDGQAAIFKMESHNHPSFIEPYQGAATGVGGILRDVFTMGARPVCNLNALRFGAPDHAKTRHLVSGVVSGIGGYGNCVGVPTVAGEVNFHPAYNGNILVNAMTVGIADQDKIFYSKASGVGSPVVYVGSKTGRDGIHGATMASAEFDDASEEKRPTVQVGDPFTEKLLIEACLELMKEDAIIAIQDMGAAGMTCSSLEMADKGGLGIELDLEKVPVREDKMTAYEIMLSESQERMLMVLKPEKQELARKIFEKWELAFAVVGVMTDTGRMVLKMNGEVVADMPVSPLSDEAPIYDRPYTMRRLDDVTIDHLVNSPPRQLLPTLETLLASPDLCSRRWIYEQYDRQVGNDTLHTGGDAAIVRIHGTKKALAVTADCTPRYCFADPVQGGRQAVAETWRNITATGAQPLAITNCLNFGNPEKMDIMGQLVGCLQGIKDACLALDYPVVSGNVSLYNETNGNAILPTPAIGGVGLLANYESYVKQRFAAEEELIFVVGNTEGHLGQSLYLREIIGEEKGAPPPVDLSAERQHGDFVRGLILEGLVTACHDVADGGLLVAIAEMALSGNIGAELHVAETDQAHDTPFWFGEDQARYVITIRDAHQDLIAEKAAGAGVTLTLLGRTSGNDIRLMNGDEVQESVTLAQLRTAHEGTLPALMGA